MGICRWWRSATILLCRATKFRLQAVWAIAFLRSNLIQKLSRMSNGLWEILCIYTALFYSQTKQFPHLDWIFKFLSGITIINDLFVVLNVCTIYSRYHNFICIGHHLLISYREFDLTLISNIGINIFYNNPCLKLSILP